MQTLERGFAMSGLVYTLSEWLGLVCGLAQWLSKWLGTERVVWLREWLSSVTEQLAGLSEWLSVVTERVVWFNEWLGTVPWLPGHITPSYYRYSPLPSGWVW